MKEMGHNSQKGMIEMETYELIKKNMASGNISKIDGEYDQKDLVKQIADDRNEREERKHKNVKWTWRVT